MENLKYEIQPYPKTENKYYETDFVPTTQMALIQEDKQYDEFN